MPALMQQRWESPGLARAAYLDMAIELRDMSSRAQSLDTQQAFMRLAILYAELADFIEHKCSWTSVRGEDH
jgi:hypothetical protein